MKKLMLCALAFVIIASGCNTAPHSAAVAVKTAEATRKSVEFNLNIASAFVPDNVVNVSAKLSGVVAELNAEVGQIVGSGDTLVVLDTKELEAQLEQAKAGYEAAQGQASVAGVNAEAAREGVSLQKGLIEDQVASAKIALDAARAALEAQKELSEFTTLQATTVLAGARSILRDMRDEDTGRYSDADIERQREAVREAEIAADKATEGPDTQLLSAQANYDKAALAYDQAQGLNADSQLLSAQSKYDASQKQYEVASGSSLKQAESAINLIEAQLSNANVSSGVSGVVVNRNISAGELAAAGTPLFTVADISTLKLKGTVSQKLLPYVRVGQGVIVSVDIYPDREFSGTVTSVGPVAVSTSSYFPVEISVDNADGGLIAGESARAVIHISGENRVAVPNSAVVRGNGQTYLFVIENGKPKKREVVTGLRGDEETEILSGLEAGEIVAVSNTNVLFDDMQITIE